MRQPRSSASGKRQKHAGAQVTRAVFLVGFMGSGKSSVGRGLARRLGWRFVDLDRRIERRQRQKIADIFRLQGEAAFRRMEDAELEAVLGELKQAPAVIALGGGTLTRDANARRLRRPDLATVFLHAPVEELRRRCRTTGQLRPLFADVRSFRRLYRQRLPAYRSADCHVNTLARTVAAVAAEIEGWLRTERNHPPKSRRRRS